MTSTPTSSSTSAPPARAPEARAEAVPARSVAALPRENARAAASGESAARAFRALLGGKAEAAKDGEGARAGARVVAESARDASDGPPAAMLDQPPEQAQGHAMLPVDADAGPAGAVSGPAATAALAIDPAAAEAVRRMADAVSAALAQGRDPVFSIRFNDPGALSEGALLIRDAGGALTVRLEGVAAAALALPPRALEDSLRVALDRRRVRLGRLEWGSPAGFTKSQRFADRT